MLFRSSFADSIRKIDPTPERGIEQEKLEMIQRLTAHAEDAVKAETASAAKAGRKSISGVLGLWSDTHDDRHDTIYEIGEKSLDDVELYQVSRFIKTNSLHNTIEIICNGESNISCENSRGYLKYVVFSQDDLKNLCSSVSEMIYNLGFQIYSVATVEWTFHKIERIKGFFGGYKEKRRPTTTGRVLKIEVSW